MPMNWMGKARRGDAIVGWCWHPIFNTGWPFPGIHIGNPTNLMVNNQDAVRVGDISLHFCPAGVGIAITGAYNDFGSLIEEHRQGDLVLPIGPHFGLGFTVATSEDSMGGG